MNRTYTSGNIVHAAGRRAKLWESRAVIATGAAIAALALGACNAGPESRPFGAPTPPFPGGDDDAVDSDGSEEEETGSTGEAVEENDIDSFILDLGHLPLEDLFPKTETECFADCPSDGQEGDEWCSYVHYSETQHAHELVAFQPNSATLWPGNIVQGQDAEHGILTPIGLPRAPMSFSVSLENLQNSPVGHMESPSLSSFREQRNEILSGGTTGATPAHVAFDISQVHNLSQVAVSLGGSVNWLSGSLSTMFDFSNTQEATKVLVDFTQSYYTIDVDTPGMPSDLFTDEVTLEEIEQYMGEENPPLYVQSITYGRRVVFAIESSYSARDVQFALEAGFSTLSVGGGIELETQYLEVIENSKISALVLGGAGVDAVQTVTGLEGLFQYISAGGDYSQDSPGAAIAYKLAYFDNSGVKLALSTDYSERQCYDNFVDVKGELARMEYLGGNDDNGSSVEVFGNVEFRIAGADDPDPCRPDAPGWHRVFDRGSSGPQDVHGMWVPTDPPSPEIYDFEVDPDNSLCIRGHLKEADDCWFCDDDDFGTGTLGPIPLSQGWAGEHTLEFSDEGTVAATVRITVD